MHYCNELCGALGYKSLIDVDLAIFGPQNFMCVVPFNLKQPYGKGIYDHYPYLDEALNL